MKSILMKIVILFTSISLLGLVSCSSTNTQSQNTGIGAVSGAVVGGIAGGAIGGAGAAVGGAIAGALIGGVIGHSMDNSDMVTTHQAMSNRTHRSTTWVNTRTGTRYTVTPISNRMTINGNPNCRKYRSTAVINGKTQHVYGVACRQADGSWMEVVSR